MIILASYTHQFSKVDSPSMAPKYFRYFTIQAGPHWKKKNKTKKQLVYDKR